MFTKIVRSATHTITSNIQNAASTRGSFSTHLPAVLLTCAALTLGPANSAMAATVTGGGSEAYNYLVNLVQTTSPQLGGDTLNTTFTQHDYISNNAPGPEADQDGTGPDQSNNTDGTYNNAVNETTTTPTGDPAASATTFVNSIVSDITGTGGPNSATADSTTDEITLTAGLAFTQGAATNVISHTEVTGGLGSLNFTANSQLDNLDMTVFSNLIVQNIELLGPLAPNTDLIALIFGPAFQNLPDTIQEFIDLGITVVGNEQIVSTDNGTNNCGTASMGAYSLGAYSPDIGCDPTAATGDTDMFAETNALHIYFRDTPVEGGAILLNGDIILGHTRAFMTAEAAQVPEINGSQLGIALSLLLSLILLYRERDGGFVA